MSDIYQLINMTLAKALVDKWKRASRELGPAVKAFNDIRDASGEERSREWDTLARQADAKRVTDVKAMDIYDMHRNTCKLSHYTNIKGCQSMTVLVYSAYKATGGTAAGSTGSARGYWRPWHCIVDLFRPCP